MPFGNPATYKGHSGVDFPQATGTPILASAPGTVISRGWNSRGGFYVWVKYDGVDSAVGYHHMPNHDKTPATGKRVKFREQIGHVGSTGNSTGPHLHSEVQGHATTDGYWKYFDRNKTVHDTAPTPPPTQEDEDDMNEFYAYCKEHDKGYAIRGGRKRWMKRGEWNAMRAQKFGVADISAADADEIPNA